MRFCPFCSAENQDAATECAVCARRLPPLPPRRRKNGPEQSDIGKDATELAPIQTPEATPEAVEPAVATKVRDQTPVQALLGSRPKTLADMIVSPAAERRSGTVSEPAPEGISDRRKPTAIPSARGRRRTRPPIPSRTERDRIAAMSTGVAPGLASESIPLPKRNSEATRNTTSDEGWPAPSLKSAAHPDDWNLEKKSPPVSDGPPAEAIAAAGNATVASPGNSESAQQPADVSAARQAVVQTGRPVALSEPFKAPDVAPVPNVPEAGLVAAVKYTVSFARARWQRRSAIGDLREQISKDTGFLDGILGTLGRQTRSLGIENKALETENRAIDSAEERRRAADHSCSELSNRQAEENSKFADSEAERQGKVAEADKALEIAQTELGAMEAQRRDLRDQRKSIETRQKGYLKAADSRDADAEKQDSREKREELRAAASTLRKDAEQLSHERQDMDRRYDALEEPLGLLSSRVDALKSDRDAAKRGLVDLREGHRHRLAEIDAEQGRKSRELAQAEAEIERRYVTLGTLVNLNRIDRDEFVGLYEQIDTLRGAIGARSNEIDKLSAERQAFDKASLIRGACVLGGAFLLFLALLAILLAAT